MPYKQVGKRIVSRKTGKTVKKAKTAAGAKKAVAKKNVSYKKGHKGK